VSTGRKPVASRRLAALAIAVLAASLPAAGASAGSGGAPAPGAEPDPQPPIGATPFDRQGQWIWYVSRSEGGGLGRIIARARKAGVGTVYIKAGDADSTWRQFNRPTVDRLQAGGLDVCAWTFVYGQQPVDEAKVAATAVARGADCYVIDAEGHYEGRYASADRFIRALRARIGGDFPVALATFPYVDYHPGFPYSVFLGPGGAQYNQPQMYWKAIGTSVRGVYEHTYLYNRVFQRPIYPIGQTYSDPGRKPILRFRRFAQSYGGLPPSWWSWQETNAREWSALGSRTAGRIAGYRPVTSHPVLRRGSAGDLVVWAQQHLVAAGQEQLPVTGYFKKLTYRATRAFQRDHGLPVTGVIASRTWRRLLRFRPVRVNWSAPKRRARGTGVAALRPAPPSAALPARGYEIDPGPRP
jgi:hypothetical protein